MSDDKHALKILNEYYKIKGDGVAELKLDKAVKNPVFINTIKAMARVKVDAKEEGVAEDKHQAITT